MDSHELNQLVYHEVCRRAVEAGVPFAYEQKKLLRWALGMAELPEDHKRYLPPQGKNA